MAFEKKPDYMRMERRQLLNLLFLNSTYIVHKYTHNFSWAQIKKFSEIQKYKIEKGQTFKKSIPTKGKIQFTFI